jgi:hypothetical protein
LANNALPEGFTLDQPPAQSTAQQSGQPASLPSGFILDRPPVQMPDGTQFRPGGSGQTLSQGPAEPGVIQNAVNQVGNFGRVTANNATLGGADYLTGKLGADGGIGVAGERALTQNAAMDLGHYGNAAAGLTGGALQSAMIPAGGPVRAALGSAAMGGAASAMGDYLSPSNDKGVMGIDPAKAAGAAGLGLVGAMGGNAFGFAQQPVTQRLHPTIRDQYNLLQNEHVQVSPGQALAASSGDDRPLTLESRGNDTQGFYPRQLEDFTTAALRHAGIDNNRLVPGELDQHITDVGQVMNGLAARNPINDPSVLVPLYRELRTQTQTWMQNHNGQINHDLSAATSNVMRAAQRGELTGPQFQDTVSTLGQAAAGGDHAAGRMRETIQNAMETHIQNTNPADLGGWQQANLRYGNLMALKNVADNSSTKATSGFVTPSELITGVRQAQGSRALATGNTDLGGLAQAGQSLIRPHPVTSQTNRFGEGVGGAAGAGLGHHVLGPAGAFIGKSLGEAAGGAVESALRPFRPLEPLSGQSIMPGANQPQNRVLGNALGLGAAGAVNPFTRAVQPRQQ